MNTQTTFTATDLNKLCKKVEKLTEISKLNIMKLQNTEKMYWVNGIQKRGKDFFTITSSFKSFALMLAFSYSMKFISLNFFKLN